jgi:hypothetical protein
MARYPGGTAIEIQVRIIIEITDLCLPEFVNNVAVPQSQVPATGPMGCFDDRAIVTCSFQFIGNGKTCYASPKNCYFFV